MKNPVQLKIAIASLGASLGNLPLRRGTLLVLLGVSCALTPPARALLPPPAPDGGYPGGNTAEGDSALFSLATGFANTAIGFGALQSNTDGHNNTAVGADALNFNTTGGQNTATGFSALINNKTGSMNTADGELALYSNTTGSNNTATGVRALLNNTIGASNTASGWQALNHNLSGANNTANGVNALFSNIDGIENTASGWRAAYNNTTGLANTATGSGALLDNTTGRYNTAAGWQALLFNTAGDFNIALGAAAGQNLTGSNNIDIGNLGVGGESNVIRIGTEGNQTATFIAGIKGTPIAVGVAVGITAEGQLGVRASSKRFKEAIKPMDKTSEAILALQPVIFHYKKELDPEGIRQFGLVAEEVEKVNPDLVARDEQGKPYTVRYEAVNAMLLNEFLKEHRRVEALEATVAKLESVVQKVSNQIELTKPRPQVVVNE